MQLFGLDLAYAINASYSVSNAWINECAIVPTAGISNILPAFTLEVPTHPPMYAYLAALVTEYGPWPLLEPKSDTGAFASLTILLAPVETSGPWL